MKKEKNESSKHPELLTTERLCDIWKKILSDRRAKAALERLAEAGFPIAHLQPSDATFRRPSWADYIAALPLLPNEPSTRHIHRKATLRKHWPLVRELRRFAAQLNASPFSEVEISGVRDYPVSKTESLRDDLLKAATTLEHFLFWDYSVRDLNRRDAVIAELRWTIRERTGRPHDRELIVLIDAAFRAAGHKEGCYIGPTALDRIERREKESRVKATRRIRV